ncbi:hypothetical protein [Aurantibacter aestuarii]|uniref:Apea-like HEPN domain-containing protein n=1 Tax=Aurantibacter aestuarii TaxID=1266046 RepID=A0A2T1N6V5_9FLAO|nr:hypothetical protein [Aurantibacter aestuarii]PSG87307.1 hypothetical protein C7H52_11175 [Aurantibacter aestuarii]
MERFIIFVEGLELEENFTYTFCNGFMLCHFSKIEDEKTAKLLETFTKHTDYYILFKELHKENINPDIIDEARDILDIISIHLRDFEALYISAASSYAVSNIPRMRSLGIRTKIDSEILELANHQLTRLNAFEPKNKNKLRVSLRFLNKSKDRTKIDTSIDHAIFIRVAMENIFGSPYNKIRNTVSERAPILLTEFNESELISGFKRFYDQTSKAIHTGIVPKKPIKSRDKKVIIGGKRMYDLLALSVSRLLENGFPDWDAHKLSFRQRLKIKIIKFIEEKF